jgi:hypothetical protein
MINNVLRGVAIALVLAAVLSCDRPTAPRGPRGGPLTLTLTTPNADDGALLLSLSGAGIDSVTSVDGTMLEVLSSGSEPRLVIVRGALANGPIARVWVADVNGAYTAAVGQVSARGTYAQRSLNGYELALAP